MSNVGPRAAPAGMLSSTTSHSGRITSANGMESIVSHLATSVAMGTWQIHAYFRDLRVTDRAVNAFTSDLESMAVACDVVGKLMTEHSGQREEQMQQLWDCLEARLRACNNTVSQLELAVDCAKQGVKKDKTALGRMIRQIRRDGSSKDLEEARSEIQTHAVSLQVIIHTVRVQFLYLSTGKADSSMCAELAHLKAKKQELQKLRARRDPKQFDSLNKNETEVLWISDAIVFSGESLYASNVSAGSQVSSQAPSRAAYTQTWVGSITCDPPTPETDTPSVFSHPRSRGLSNPLTPETDTPSVFSHSPGRRISALEDVADEQVPHPPPRANLVDSESEDEIDIDIETAQRLVASGRSYFDKEELQQASSRLSEARKIILDLPEARENAFNLLELFYMIGVCAFYLEEPSMAASSLQEASEQHRKSGTSSRSEKIQVAEISHMLARTFLKLEKFENARTSCQEALKCRRKLLGKRHESYLESLELMASIWEADGNLIRAQVYRDMLAEGQGDNGGMQAASSSLHQQVSGSKHDPTTGTSLQPNNVAEVTSEDVAANAPNTLSVRRKAVSMHLQQLSDFERDTFKEVSPTSARITDVAFGPLASDVPRQERADYPYPFRFTESVPATFSSPCQSFSNHSILSRECSIGMSPVEPLTEHATVQNPVQRYSTINLHRQTIAPTLNLSGLVPTEAAPINDVPAKPRLVRATSNIAFVPATASSRSSNVAPHQSESSATQLNNSRVKPADNRLYGKPDSSKPPQTTPHHRVQPADFELRRLWTFFFGITPRKELSQALLENREQDALNLIPDEYQKKKMFSSKLLKSKSSSPIERRDLQLASLFGDSDVVDKLLSSGSDLAYNRSDLEGVSALHCAAIGGNYQITANLISARQPVEVVLDKYGTPLSLAVLSERTDVADLLLANTLNPHAKCGNLGSVIHAACMTGNATLLGHLSQRIGKSALDAPAIVYPSVVRQLRSMIISRSLTDLADEATLVHDSAERLEHMDARPLAVAAYLGCEQVVEHLISQNNVDIDAKCGAWSAPNMEDPKGSNEHTALTMAAAGGHDAVLRMLLEKGANLTPRKFVREDALLMAVLNDRTTCALLLLEHGAPISSTSFREATKRSMLPLVTKMRAKRAGLDSSKLSTFSNDKSCIVVSADSVSESFS